MPSSFIPADRGTRTALLAVAALIGLFLACSGGAVFPPGTEGGMLFGGDDLIRVKAAGAENRGEAMDRVLRTLGAAQMRVDTLDRNTGYLRTKMETLSDTVGVRLITISTDSAEVELSGQVTDPHGEPREWSRIAWTQGEQVGTTPWTVMHEFAQALGTIQTYEEGPDGMYTFPCGGRRCEQGQVCQNNVCRDQKWQRTIASDAQPASADEHAPAGTNRPVVNQAIIEYTNQERTSRGLEPLTPDTTLTRIACWHNQDMIADGYFEHEDSDGRGPSDRVNREHRRLIGTVGENIRVGGAVENGSSRQDRREIGKTSVERWMDSPGHRRNILKPRYTHIGACYTDNDRGRGTQLFATVYAYLDQPLPWTMSPGDSLSTSVTPVKVPGEAIRYAFVSPDESDEKTLERAFDEEAASPLDGMLYAPKQPGLYELRVFFQLEGGVTFRSGPRMKVKEQ